jgi:hypothetical protein
MTDEPRIALADALPGLAIHPLQDGDIPVSAFMVIKVLDEEGSPSWSFRTTEAFNKEELLGALIIQVELVKASLLKDWEGDE